MSPASPTAQTLPAPTAVTAVSPTFVGSFGSGCGGSGTATTCQALPFQCSTSGSLKSSPRLPTAQMSWAFTTARPVSALKSVGGCAGASTTDHWWPFQCCTRMPGPTPVGCEPTAQTSVGDTAATADSRPPGGVGTTRHRVPS